MTTTLRLAYEWPSPWKAGRYDLMQRRLDYLCAAYWWYEDGIIEGQPFGRMLLAVTVSGRDRWWVLQRGLDLAVEVFAIAGIKRPPFPVWDRLDMEKARQ